MAAALQASMQTNQNFGPQDIAGVSNDDAMLNKAIMDSMLAENNGVNQVTQEPLNPEQRKREASVPCGLKNIGNTCYFNSILQVYYNIPGFVQAIFDFKDDDKPLPPLRKQKEGEANPQDTAADNTEETQLVKRLDASRKLIKNMKILFG